MKQIPNARLDTNALRQPMLGFGGSQTFNGDMISDFPGRDKVYQALFQDLKLDFYRVRNYHDYPRSALKYGRGRGNKAPVRLMFTAWSPPARLKSNNLASGRSDGADKADQTQFHTALKAQRAAFPNTPLLQTEFLEGDTFVKLATQIHDTLVIGEASGYFIWMASRSFQSPSWAMVYLDPVSGVIERRERFYAMKHYSAFVGEGWNRIESSQGEDGERWRPLGKLPADTLMTLPRRSLATIRFF